ncbi:MAG: NAD(P)-binding domain-containing protein [Clostridiales bacterium]|nr:NAD(P)-binding domain-containing protein [Clostridiales bacterium]
MKICVIGGGNLGTLISAELSLSKKHEISLLATKAHLFSNEIIIDDWNDNTNKTAYVNHITADKQTALKDAELILITVPANVLPKLADQIYPFVQENAIIGMIPGSGGTEFILSKFKEKKCVIFGMQRVHSVVRIKEYGKVVMNKSRKQSIDIAVLPKEKTKKTATLISELFNMPCNTLPNYLNITFTPSNQILHTTRIYNLFYDYFEGKTYPRQSYFYKEWNDKSSKMLIACDEESLNICKELHEFDLSKVKSLLEHYEVTNAKEMTQKLSSIPSFKSITTPMIKVSDGEYIPDKNNRYFTNDFQYGLCIVKGFAKILKVNTPNIDKVLKWYEKFANVEYFIGDEFIGKDLKNTGIPQNYGINTRKDIIEFYQ